MARTFILSLLAIFFALQVGAVPSSSFPKSALKRRLALSQFKDALDKLLLKSELSTLDEKAEAVLEKRIDELEELSAAKAEDENSSETANASNAAQENSEEQIAADQNSSPSQTLASLFGNLEAPTSLTAHIPTESGVPQHPAATHDTTVDQTDNFYDHNSR